MNGVRASRRYCTGGEGRGGDWGGGVVHNKGHTMK